MLTSIDEIIITKIFTYGLGFIESVLTGLFTALGFLVSIVILASIREHIEFNDIPESFKGTPIVLVTASLMEHTKCFI